MCFDTDTCQLSGPNQERQSGVPGSGSAKITKDESSFIHLRARCRRADVDDAAHDYGRHGHR